MITNIERAHAALADALWWLRGFSAAGEGHSGAASLAEKLFEVREFLNRLGDAKVRRIGDEQAIVLKYGEFEVLFDGVRGRPTEQDRRLGQEAAEKILRQYQSEQPAPEIPF